MIIFGPTKRRLDAIRERTGQPAERSDTIAALGRAMPFVRRELGKTLRLRRIPDLHIQLDDTASWLAMSERLLTGFE